MPRLCARAARCWAWQIATASASAASGERAWLDGQQHPDHHRHLGLLGVADADDCLLDEIGRVFGDRQALEGERRERDAARLAELQRRLRIAVDESLLDRRLGRPLAFDEARERAMDRREPLGERGRRVGVDRAAGDIAEARSHDLDHAPAGVAQAGVDAEDANRAPVHEMIS